MTRDILHWSGVAWFALATACEAAPTWLPYAGLSVENLDETLIVEAQRDGANASLNSPSEPFLRMGVVEGAAPYQFSGIAGVLRLEDGRILVADGGSKELRLFSADGRHLRSVGGSGQGPGEFQQILWMKPIGSDRVLTWDAALSRGSVFTTEGEFIRHVSLPVILDYPLLFPENAFIDGSILTQAGPPRDVVDEAGRSWKVVTIHRTKLGATSGAERIGEFPSQLPQTESVWPKWQVAGDLLAYTRGDRPEVLILDPARRRPLVIREGGVAAPDQPELATYFDDIRIDDRGNLWAHRYETELWVVFESSGETYRMFRQPPRLMVHQIAGDHLVGVERSELGVESVVVYQLSAR